MICHTKGDLCYTWSSWWVLWEGILAALSCDRYSGWLLYKCWCSHSSADAEVDNYINIIWNIVIKLDLGLWLLQNNFTWAWAFSQGYNEESVLIKDQRTQQRLLCSISSWIFNFLTVTHYYLTCPPGKSRLLVCLNTCFFIMLHMVWITYASVKHYKL